MRAAEVRARLDAESIYRQHLELQKRGAHLWARCPFHGGGQERTPSFKVDGGGRWYCFACSKGGDVLTFMQEMHGGTFPEVLRQAAGLAGVPAPVPLTNGQKTAPEPCHPLDGTQLKVWQAAYEGSPAAAYIAARSIPLGIAMAAGMGYAAEGWPGKRLHEPVVVFPLTDANGTLVSMAARRLGPDEPRWDFLPERPKAPFLGTSLAGSGALWMVEGAVDALALRAAGIDRVAALMGSSWAKLPWNVSEVVLALDADATGRAQAQKMARQAAMLGKRVRILPPEAYGGAKDVAEAWQAGTLSLFGDLVPADKREEWAERVGIMVEGGTPLAIAEQSALGI